MGESAAAGDAFGLVGELLDGKYRVDARIAEGGFGVVYAGRHIGLAKPFAIKVLKCAPETSAAERGERIGRFLEEARLAARLRHPAVVSVVDAGVTTTARHPADLPWIAMEWLDGETLADELARRRVRGAGGRTRAEALALLRPVVEAVAEAHQARIVHRDLKPSNIMLVTRRGVASTRILDFGIAKLMSGDDRSPSAVGTTGSAVRAFSVAYAAPEQLSGSRTGPWTDVYALGLLFTEVVCGRRAPARDDVDAHYRAAFDPARPTPASLGVDAGAWEPVLARALALDPRDRQASAGELLAALDAGAPAARPRAPMLPAAALTAAVVAALGAAWLVLVRDSGGDGGAVPAGRAAAVGEPGRCTSNAACSRPGAPGICVPGLGCRALGSQDCEPSADPVALASDATLWIGAMFPRTGDDAAVFGKYEVNAVELARRDFAQIMSDSAAAGAADRARPFGLLLCDDAADARRAADHLVELGVPAVIGFYKAVEAIQLANSRFVPHRILAIASSNGNPLITGVPHPPGVPRLVWRTMYSSADAAAALSAWISGYLEPALRGAGAVTGTLRVALVRPREAAGGALSDAFLATLRFNGKTALANGADYRELTIEAEAPAASPAYAAAVDELLAFAPDIVLYAGNAAIVDALFAPLEARWPARAAYRPRYASVAVLPRRLLDFIGASRDRRSRFFGVTSVSSTNTNARFVTHYNEAFPDKITRTFAPNTSYDAFYLLAYASYAIPRGEPVTGERLSRAFGKLVPPGRPLEVGLAGIFEAYAALGRGESIDLAGAASTLDLDVATGASAFDLAILCAGVDASGRASEGIESGLVYSAASNRISGAMRCP